MKSSQVYAFCIALPVLLVSLLQAPLAAQGSRYERMREWSAAGNSSKLTAKLLSVNADTVTLENSGGKQASVPIKQLSDEDQEWIADYKASLFSRLKRQSREALFAKDAFKLFRDFQAAGLIDDSNREYVESKLQVLEEEAHVNSIFFGKRFLTMDQLDAKKASTKLMVDQYINESLAENSGAEQKLIRDATKQDPTSIEAGMIAALHHEVFAANFETSGRLLEDAVKRGQRYLPVANEYEKHNVLAALNNLAISCIRENKISRALGLWEEADELAELNLPETIKHNIAKVNRMINDDASGLKAERAIQAAFGRFAETTGATGERGGWRIMLPKDIEGNYRSQIRFVILNRDAQKLSEDQIEDLRCLRCAGTTRMRCPNSSCREGAVEVPVIGERTLTLPDGSVQNLGRGRIGTRKVKCNPCNGTGLVRCPYCDQGMQNN